MVSTLNLLVIKTNSINMVKSFYELLGLTFKEERHGNGPAHYASYIGETIFEIYPLKKTKTPDKSTRLGFTVKSGMLDCLIHTFSDNGVKILEWPKQSAFGYRAIVRDPDGRTVEIYEESTQ